MSDVQKKYSMIKDFITGKEVPDIGAEANRQAVERFLVEKKGYAKEDIEVDADIEILIAGEKYCSQVDLIVSAKEKRVMLFKCAAASLASREREAIAAARLFSDEYQIPFSVVSDGESAFVQDTHSGKKKGEGMDAIPSLAEMLEFLKNAEFKPFPKERAEKEKLIFRSYDSMNVNVQRNIKK